MEKHTAMRKFMTMNAAAAISILLSICGCGHSDANHDHGHEADGGQHGNDEIVFEAAKAVEAGITCDTVRAGTFRDVISTSGKIIPATGNETAVIAGRAGIVSFSSPVAEGSPVNSGDVILTISSGNLQDGDPAQKAYIAYQTALKEYERAAILVKDKIVSQQEFERVRSNYETAKIAYEAIGGGENGGTPVKSPATGYAGKIAVKDGDYVATGQTLMRITNPDRMFLQADLSGKYIERLGRIASANFRLPFSDKIYRLEELGGRLIAEGRALDETSAYIPVTFEFDGKGEIIPGTFAEIYLLSTARDNVISLPLTALIEEQGEYYVFKKLDADCYEKVHVGTGASDGTRIEITEGLEDGDVVVTEGAMRIKLASAGNTIPGHTHNH